MNVCFACCNMLCVNHAGFLGVTFDRQQGNETEANKAGIFSPWLSLLGLMKTDQGLNKVLANSFKQPSSKRDAGVLRVLESVLVN